MNISRRNFLKYSTLAGASFSFSPYTSAITDGHEQKDHFYINIFLNSGFDHSYWFDARPLEMTKNNLIQNYLDVEPKKFVGINGQSCFRHATTDSFMPFKDQLCILNGVVMDADSDGHGQNINKFITGSALGGESFIPHLNEYADKPSQTSLDGIKIGHISANSSNTGKIVPLNSNAIKPLQQKIKTTRSLQQNNLANSYLKNKFQEISKIETPFGEGVSKLGSGFGESSSLAKNLLSMDLSSNANAEEGFVNMARGFFSKGLAKSGSFVISELFDVHDAQSARNFPATATDVANRVANLIKFLKNTEYKPNTGKSMLDVCTVSVVTEFQRTMRQARAKIDETGTDHNSLTNSIILLGKGIKGGQIIGHSDFTSSKEELSKVHMQMDSQKLKIMGRPFDFNREASTTDTSDKYDPKNYLNIDNVVNSLYDMFEIPEKHWRKYKDGSVCPVLNTLKL